MAKVYTAQEMREFANCNDSAYARNPSLCSSAVSAALRQAADALERGEKREKKHEYAVYFVYECGVDGEEHFKTLDDAKSFVRRSVISRATISRREVGEWEEVRDA